MPLPIPAPCRDHAVRFRTWAKCRGTAPLTYKNGGRELRGQGDPEDVHVHDFIGPAGKVAPYGVYDLQANDA